MVLTYEDRKICEILQEDARRSYAEIGAAVGLSVSTIAERIRKLQAAGVIRAWQVILDPAAAGCPVLAFLFVAIRGKGEEVAFRRSIQDWKEVLECHHITGDWSYLLKLRLADIAGLEAVAQRLKNLPGFERSHSLIAMSSVKETARLPLVLEGQGAHPPKRSINAGNRPASRKGRVR